MVVFRSAVAPRSNGTCFSIEFAEDSLIVMLPTPGIKPNQLDRRMNKKKDASKGKNFRVLSFKIELNNE